MVHVRSLFLRSVGLAAVPICVVAALWSGAPAAPEPAVAAPGCRGAAGPGDSVVRVRVAGVLRTARLHVPRAALGHRAPLLLAFHGTAASGRFMEGYAGLNAPAERAGAIVVYPDALGRRWQWADDDEDLAENRDVAFIAALLDRVQQRVCVDTHRIWAAGVSNGGGFSAVLGCALADRISAIAVVAGGLAALPPCHPVRRVSVLEVHGTGDPVAPYAGRPDDDGRGAVRAWLGGWTRVNGCRGVSVSRLARRVDLLRWRGCRQRTVVTHVRIAGGRHQWPGATPPDPGPKVGFAAGPAVWKFLLGLPRR